jgi:hypothetical protein
VVVVGVLRTSHGSTSLPGDLLVGSPRGISRIAAASSGKIRIMRMTDSSIRREIESGASTAIKGGEDFSSKISAVEIRCGNLRRIGEETSTTTTTTTTIALVAETQESYVIPQLVPQFLISVNV